MKRFNTNNEGEYLRMPPSEIKPESIINLPLLVEVPDGPWIALLEADYAGMHAGGIPGMANAIQARLRQPSTLFKEAMRAWWTRSAAA